jgi:hypothetical protein
MVWRLINHREKFTFTYASFEVFVAVKIHVEVPGL